jgi:prevent-host-death family protein
MKRLDIDLTTSVLPISRAASSLAALLRRARATSRPIVVTQKGCPTGVIISIPLFEELRRRAAQAAADHLLEGFAPDAPEASADDVAAFLQIDEDGGEEYL